MVLLARKLNALVAALLSPFDKLPPDWGLLAISLLTGALMLIIFRFTSNQRKIKAVKNLIKAYILEIRLYQDSPRVILQALGQIMRHNTVYLRHALVPLLIMFVPVFLILANLNTKYNYRSLRAGEVFILKTHLDKDADPFKVTLKTPEGLTVQTPPVHIMNPHAEVAWRLKVEKVGVYEAKLFYGSEIVTKSIHADNHASTISSTRIGSDFVSILLHPAEAPLPADCPFESIQVSYASNSHTFFGIRMHWLLAFFLFSLFSALLFKKPLKVEF